MVHGGGVRGGGTRVYGVRGHGADLVWYPWYGSGPSVWPGFALFGRVLPLFCPIWPCLPHLAVFGLILAVFALIWPHFGCFCPNLAVLGPNLAVLGLLWLFGPTVVFLVVPVVVPESPRWWCLRVPGGGT